MKRQAIQMKDPIFPPGVGKTAVASITVSPSGLACQAELFLGPNENTKIATSGLRNFVSIGTPQNVSLPVTMPIAGGAYGVFLDIYVEGTLLLAFEATEDVIIPEVTVGPITWT